MNLDRKLLVLKGNDCRILVEPKSEGLAVQIERKEKAAWILAAYLPAIAIERPGTRSVIPYLDARLTSAGLELVAYLEDEHGSWRIIDRVIPSPNGFQVTRSWNHAGGMDPQVALLFEVAYSGLEVDFWMIPGLMVQGNPQCGSGYHQTSNGVGPQPGLLYPSGWDLGGVPWAFSEEATIPSATWLRRGAAAMGVFAQPQAGLHDLLSAVSLSRLEDRQELRSTIYLPSRDMPVLYRDKNGFTPGRQAWLLVSGDWQYQRNYFIVIYTETPPFPLAGLNRAAWSDLAPYRQLPTFSVDEIQKLRLEFVLAHHLRESSGYCGLVQGLYNDGTVRENWMSDGFLSLNAEFASFLYAYGKRTGDAECQRIARHIATFFTSNQFENGLFFSTYYLDTQEWGNQFGSGLCFTRPMGERLWSLAELAEMLDPADSLRRRILTFCQRSADFFVRNQLENGSFGKTWTKDGRLVEDSSANFSFITWFLCRLYRLDPDQDYLAAAERSFQHLRTIIDAEQIESWVDCLDSAAIDREGAAAYLQALNALYEITGKEQYLYYARKSAELALTWQYVYDICFEVDTPLGWRMFATRPEDPEQTIPQDGVSIKPVPTTPFHSAGMTMVSVEHPCMDAWGARLGYELLRLSSFTGETHYWERGCAAVMAAQQVIARKPGQFGLELIGAQPEQLNSRDWAYGYIALGKGSARVLIAWNQVLNLATLERLRSQFPDALEWMKTGGRDFDRDVRPDQEVPIRP